MDTSKSFEDELRAEVAKIRAAYPWLEESTIERYAEQAIKNKQENKTF